MKLPIIIHVLFLLYLLTEQNDAEAFRNSKKVSICMDWCHQIDLFALACFKPFFKLQILQPALFSSPLCN